MAKKRMTVYELAEACGVSIATISRVINGSKAVSPETRERIHEQMQKLVKQFSSMGMGKGKKGKNMFKGMPFMQ